MTSAAPSTASASPHTLPGQRRQHDSTARTGLTWMIAGRSSPTVHCARCRRPRTHPFLLSLPARCLRSSLLRDADVLYVQVDGQGGAGALRLQPQDFVQDVMQRAVKEELIDPIRWREVTGWKLLDSRAEKAKQLHSGTSSERLLKLLPFPEESLLVLTRRPIPPTSSSSASSPSASSSLPSSSSYSQPCYPPALQLQ
jgi:hypothetical protein